MAKLEVVDCPMCGSRDREPMYEKDGFGMVRCPGCDLVYLNPRLPYEDLVAAYNAGEFSPIEYYEQNIPQDTRTFQHRLRVLAKHAGGSGRLLDIGCNIGTLMRVASEHGWTPTGVEFNKNAARYAREHYGLDIRDVPFLETEFDDDHFDVVVMSDVIEHLTEPMETLEECHRILKPGGTLLLTTPNVGAPVARLSGKRWLHFKPNEHLLYFTPETLGKMLDRTGFEMTTWQSIGRVRTLETLVQKTRTYTSLIYPVASILPLGMRESIAFSINPGDEMIALARKV